MCTFSCKPVVVQPVCLRDMADSRTWKWRKSGQKKWIEAQVAPWRPYTGSNTHHSHSARMNMPQLYSMTSLHAKDSKFIQCPVVVSTDLLLKGISPAWITETTFTSVETVHILFVAIQ